MYKLNDRLKNDTVKLGELELCDVLYLPDAQVPWVILVPKLSNAIEWIDLSEDQQFLLTKEISLVSRIFKANFNPDKINIGALGNMVPQLHIHVIGRYKSDRSWPNAIWGTSDLTDESKITHYQDIIKKGIFLA